MSENHNGMDETHPTSPRTLAASSRFLVAARAPQRTSPIACPREADERDPPPPRPAACPAAAAAASAPPAACHYQPACRQPHRQPSGPVTSATASELARDAYALLQCWRDDGRPTSVRWTCSDPACPPAASQTFNMIAQLPGAMQCAIAECVAISDGVGQSNDERRGWSDDLIRCSDCFRAPFQTRPPLPPSHTPPPHAPPPHTPTPHTPSPPPTSPATPPTASPTAPPAAPPPHATPPAAPPDTQPAQPAARAPTQPLSSPLPQTNHALF